MGVELISSLVKKRGSYAGLLGTRVMPLVCLTTFLQVASVPVYSSTLQLPLGSFFASAMVKSSFGGVIY